MVNTRLLESRHLQCIRQRGRYITGGHGGRQTPADNITRVVIKNGGKKVPAPTNDAEVGETSILTRAALTVVNANKGNLISQEGAYGTHLLSYDLVGPPIKFGPGGVIEFGLQSE